MKRRTKASKARIATTVPAILRSMQSRLIGRSALTSSSAAPTAQTVCPAIMIANAGAVGIARRRQAAKARAPDSAAATPKGIARGLLWNVIIPAPTRPKWNRFSKPVGLSRLDPTGKLNHTQPSVIRRGDRRWKEPCRPRIRLQFTRAFDAPITIPWSPTRASE